MNDGMNDPIIRAKGILDGATTLQEAATKAQGFAAYLLGLKAAGYVLDEPVSDDYGFLSKP